jgi:hypothetical protein
MPPPLTTEQRAGGVPWRAVAGPVVAILAVTGLAAIAAEVGLGHPQAVRLAAEGRHVEGTVLRGPLTGPAVGLRRTNRRSLIAVDDPELGSVVVDDPRALLPRARVPMLCLTPTRRCDSAAIVEERVRAWPLTPLMLTGAAALALAVPLAFVGRAAASGSRRA